MSGFFKKNNHIFNIVVFDVWFQELKIRAKKARTSFCCITHLNIYIYIYIYIYVYIIYWYIFNWVMRQKDVRALFALIVFRKPMPPWKRLWVSQHMQRTWWQSLATPHTELIVNHRQNKLSAQLPQATRSQTGKWEEFQIGPQYHLVSLSGNLPIVQARDTLSRRSYQPIVLTKPLMAPLISCS